MSTHKPKRLSLILGLLIALLGTSLVPASASADLGSPLFRFGQYGTGAGDLAFIGGGLDADPASGHIFVSELENKRVSEFTAWGEFVKAWGWGVADGTSPELQVCTETCFKGLPGAGPGQFFNPNGIALSPSGDVYVFERNNNRVQVFSQAGAFLRMFGGEVNKTTHTDICAAGGDECGAGVSGTGPSEFSIGVFNRTTADYIDFAPDGTLWAGDKGRIQHFGADGTFLGSLTLPEAKDPGALAVDQASGDIYFSFGFEVNPEKAYRLDESTGAVIYDLPTKALEGIATDPAGNVYVSDDPEPSVNSTPENNPLLREINTGGELVASCCISTSKPGEDIWLPALTSNVVTAAGGVDLYVIHSKTARGVSFIEVRGPAPDKWPPPIVPPSIESQYASSVRGESAVLKAEINPNFWSDTSYHVEYGTSGCAGGGCAATPERSLHAGIVKEALTSEGIALSGLAPGTTYHYRFVAKSGGGPTNGPDQTFTTYPAISPPPASCPNQAFRTGSSAALGDCRAFEQVSPVDKAGGDIAVALSQNGSPARLQQAAPLGEKITYSSLRPFGEAISAPYVSQYLATREASGWSNQNISPPSEGPAFIFGGSSLDSQYKAFSEDLSSGLLVQYSEPLLAPNGVPGYYNLYRRSNPSPGYEALTTVTPIGVAPSDYAIEVQGFSSDHTHTVFRTNGKLTPDAATPSDPNAFQVYEAFEGSLRLVSVKPNGKAAATSSSVGSVASGSNNNREVNVASAVSEDGSRIYWTESGALFLRNEGVETIPVSAGKAAATFWAASPDGAEALYGEGGELKLFDLDSRTSASLATGLQGVMGASEDLSRIYFASTAALATGAKAGALNLYLYEKGQPLRYLGQLAKEDSVLARPSPITLNPQLHVASVSADGETAIFMSRASLTGSDNIDAQSGEADAQVFRYDADSDELDCVSCNPTGARPVGRERIGNDSNPDGYWRAAQIPGREFQLHEPRALSADGNRVFFNSTDRLTFADTNGVQDVYQWQAPGSGECSGSSAPGFNPKAGGCLTLITDGQGSTRSEFVDASADGSDVFFLTGVSLLSWDPGQIDVYDARVNGGFPPPPSPPAGCEGEACQNPVVPPPAQPFSSQTFKGPGNPPAAAKKKSKKKQKQKKKSKRKQHKKAKRATGGKR